MMNQNVYDIIIVGIKTVYVNSIMYVIEFYSYAMNNINWIRFYLFPYNGKRIEIVAKIKRKVFVSLAWYWMRISIGWYRERIKRKRHNPFWMCYYNSAIIIQLLHTE